jgi:hypothetical protein
MNDIAPRAGTPLDFPANPTAGQQYIVGTTIWTWDGAKWEATGGGGSASITVGDTPPSSPQPGALWWDSVGGQLYLYYADPNSNEWVPATNNPGSVLTPLPVSQGGTGSTTAPAALTALGAASATSVAALANNVAALANPNKLLNPFCEIDQANEGAATTASGAYIVDGFLYGFTTTGGAITRQRNATGGPLGYPYNISATVTTAATSVAAGDYYEMQQRLEGDELYDTLWGTTQAKPVTLSFWVLCSIAGTYSVTIINYAGNRSFVAPYTISVANTWQLVTITVPGDTVGTWVTSGNALALYLGFWQAVGTTYQTPTGNTWLAGQFFATTGITNTWATTAGAVFRLGPCKLEVGPIATPMLRNSIAQELIRCQRHYEKSYDIGTAVGTVVNNGMIYLTVNAAGLAAQVAGRASFAVIKRAVPTITGYSPSTGAAGKARDYTNVVDLTVNPFGVGLGGLNLYVAIGAAGGTPNVSYHWVADARL